MQKHIVVSSPKSAVKVKTVVTPRGLALWLVESYAVPLVSLEFAIRGGSAQDPTDKAGLGMLLAGLLDEGAGELDAQAFQRALDEKAIEISFHSDRDAMSGRMRTLTKNLDRAAELLRLAINQPRFDEEPFIRVRENANARLRHDANDPGSMAAKAWKAHAFAGHPYGQPTDGALDTLALIERADLAAAAKRLLARDQLVVAVVGAIDEKSAGELVDRAFADLPAKADLKPVAAAPFAGLGKIDAIPLDVPQSTIRFGRPGLMRDDPDYIASVVAAHVLGGSGNMTSRLFREVREKRGLAYTVFGNFYAYDHGAYYYGGTTTKNERARESFDVASHEIRDVALKGLSEEELEKGKTYLIGSYPLRFDTSVKIAAQLVHIQLEGRSPEWLVERNVEIAAVSGESLKRAAERAFGDGSLYTTVVGKPEGF
ncbi:MAG: pitrilysin family protein [Roseiarcus sp.]|uniref:M16 family metallopeptidase n=1 Tax=Roseiarcus sp. TaxID=1969460 RepID=UPI003BB089C5